MRFSPHLRPKLECLVCNSPKHRSPASSSSSPVTTSLPSLFPANTPLNLNREQSLTTFTSFSCPGCRFHVSNGDMAVFCDLEDDCSSHSLSHFHTGSSYHEDRLITALEGGMSKGSKNGGVQNIRDHSLTFNKIAAALICYPYAFDGWSTSPVLT